VPVQEVVVVGQGGPGAVRARGSPGPAPPDAKEADERRTEAATDG
jgi:hypothetical protein